MQPTDRPVAVSSVPPWAGVGAYGVVPRRLLTGPDPSAPGGLAAAAQIISHEIAMGSVAGRGLMFSDPCRPVRSSAAQEHRWFILACIVSFVIYVVTMVGETTGSLRPSPRVRVNPHRRFPHGVPSPVRDVLSRRVRQHVHGLCPMTTVFLGGWQAPPGIAAINDGACSTTGGGACSGSSSPGLHVLLVLRGHCPDPPDRRWRFGWKLPHSGHHPFLGRRGRLSSRPPMKVGWGPRPWTLGCAPTTPRCRDRHRRPRRRWRACTDDGSGSGGRRAKAEAKPATPPPEIGTRPPAAIPFSAPGSGRPRPGPPAPTQERFFHVLSRQGRLLSPTCSPPVVASGVTFCFDSCSRKVCHRGRSRGEGVRSRPRSPTGRHQLNRHPDGLGSAG